jgi:hypothetical protein
MARKVYLLDLMIMLAAIAVALAVERSAEAVPFRSPLESLVFRLLRFSIYLLACLSLATFALWLLRAPWKLSQLVRHPGFSGPAVASAAAVVMSAAYALVHILEVDPELCQIFPFVAWFLTGITVATAWSVQAWAGLWQPVPLWYDRLGRLLGTLWIAGAVLWFVCLLGR